jgi:hypothetical protein
MSPLHALLSLFLSLLSFATALDEVNDFCSRWDHQSIVKNDRLYIDGTTSAPWDSASLKKCRR